MRTEKFIVSGDESRISAALKVIEEFGKGAGLDKKEDLHLRLLAEELFGMLRGIAGETESECGISGEGKKIQINLKSQIALTQKMREQLISVSTSGKNSATAGFTGKIRTMIANVLLSAEEAIPYAMVNTAAAYTAGSAYEGAVYVWSMQAYKNEVEKNIAGGKESSAEWDQLEKSIVANIADDIKVSISGKTVQITVFKEF